MNYRNAVEFYASTNSEEIFDNLGPSHAANVLEKIFKYADKEIFMFSGTLNKEVADNPDLIREVTTFLKEKKKINIFLENIPQKEEDKSNLYKILLNHSKNHDNVIIKKAPNEFITDLKNIFKSGRALHFIVTNNFAFRIEIDADKFKAKCSFNHEDYSNLLLKTFKKYI